MMNSELDQLMDRLATVPIDINRSLRLIRMLDEKAVALQDNFKEERKSFIKEVKQMRHFRVEPLPENLIKKAAQLKQKCIQLIAYQKEKKDIADQLHSSIREHQRFLAKELKTRCKNKVDEQILNKARASANQSLNKPEEDDYLYDSKECVYCYCGRSSFGQMVACQNPFCEKQWFHLECLETKDLPDKWFCKTCATMIQEAKNPAVRQFLFKQFKS